MALTQETLAIVAATFFGPLAAVGLTLWRESVSTKYIRRLHVFRTLMATRRVGISVDHVNALNLVEVDFYKCKNVEKAWSDYKDHLNDSGKPEDEAWYEKKERLLAKLLFELAAVLGFKISAIDIFKGGYAPKGWAYRDLRNAVALEYIYDLSQGKNVLPMWVHGVTPQQASPVASSEVKPQETPQMGE